MRFDREYFLDEVRDGFFIPGMMKRQWAICIEDYRRLVEVCSEHGLMCMATWGTLIGAVRHGGFIPWDDDVDIDMLREDFEKLVAFVGKDEKAGQYHIDDFTTAKNTNMVRRWMEKTVMIYEPERWGERYGFPFGNAIDIFVLDAIPQDREGYLEYLRVIYLCESLRTDYISIGEKKETPEMQEKISELEGIVGYKVDVERDGLEGVQLFKVLDAYLNGITVKSNEKNKDTYRRACASEYIRNQRYIAPKSDTYDGCIEIPFENTTIPVPYGYDGLLRQLFRSYITPVRVFGGHMYPSYDSLRNPLRDEYGFELLTYHFDEEEYKRIISERHTKRSLDEVIRDQVALFKEAHEYIHAVTDSGDKSRYQEVCDLLGQCQELAVNLGHMIEVRAKEPEEVIHILEQYCEVVFGLYDGISNGTDITEQLKLMDECEKNFFGDAFERLSEKKEVVFLVDRAKNWNSLHTIWKAASEDDDTQVVVIAVPYAYKDEFGMIPENLWETDADRLPDEVELTPYDEYDFCLHSPDMVVYQNPYDAYSDGISVHPMFYAENMCKYTDNMVFIPPFILDEIIPEDFRGRYTLGTFARNPGLVYADKIIVQSEAMAEVYAELLSEMTGDVIDWKTRIIGIGSGMKDYDATCKKLAFNIRRSMSKNPRILFYIGASMLYDNGLPALEKKRAIFEHLTKREYEEEKFTVDIYRDPYAEEILQNTRPEVYEAYVEWLDGAKNKVVSGADIDVKELADKYDAFYGDGGVLLNEFVTKEKPYIWENPEATYMEEDMSGFLVNVKEAMKEPEVTKDGEMIWKSICVEGG